MLQRAVTGPLIVVFTTPANTTDGNDGGAPWAAGGPGGYSDEPPPL